MPQSDEFMDWLYGEQKWTIDYLSQVHGIPERVIVNIIMDFPILKKYIDKLRHLGYTGTLKEKKSR